MHEPGGQEGAILHQSLFPHLPLSAPHLPFSRTFRSLLEEHTDVTITTAFHLACAALQLSGPGFIAFGPYAESWNQRQLGADRIWHREHRRPCQGR